MIEINEYTHTQMPRFTDFTKFLNRIVILHIRNVLFLIAFIASLVYPSLGNIIFLALVFISLHSRRGIGSPVMAVIIMLYTQFLMVTIFIIQLPTFASQFTTTWAAWLGLSINNYWSISIPYSSSPLLDAPLSPPLSSPFVSTDFSLFSSMASFFSSLFCSSLSSKRRLVSRASFFFNSLGSS